MISKIEIEKIAAKTSFIKNKLEQVYRMLSLLQEISRHPISERLALKGGTVINHFFFDYPRLSIDLDFDFTIPGTKEKLADEIKAIANGLESIFRFFKYEFKSRSQEGFLAYHALYNTLWGGKEALKVEVNFLLRQPLEEPRQIETQSPFDFKFKVRALSAEEIYAAKTTALFTRTQPRDLFDIYHLISHGNLKLDNTKLKNFFYFYVSLSRVPFSDFTIENINALPDKEIENYLWPLLRVANRASKAKMLKAITPFLNEVLSPSAKQKEYLQSFYDKRPNFNLIFSGDLSKALVQHPMVLWRQRQT